MGITVWLPSVEEKDMVWVRYQSLAALGSAKDPSAHKNNAMGGVGFLRSRRIAVGAATKIRHGDPRRCEQNVMCVRDNRPVGSDATHDPRQYSAVAPVAKSCRKIDAESRLPTPTLRTGRHVVSPLHVMLFL